MDTNQNKGNTSFKITDNWNEQTKVLQGKFPQHTTAELQFETGKEESLLSRIATLLNKIREVVINIIRKVQ